MVEQILRQPLRLKLFANADGRPLEASGFGYKDARLTVVSIINDPESVKAAFAPVTFKFDGPLGRVYGSYAIHESSGTVLWVDKLDEAFKAVNRGDSITIEPVFMLRELEVVVG
jgi:hypothetical protein